MRSLDDKGRKMQRQKRQKRGIRRERKRRCMWRRRHVDFGFGRIGAGRSERLDHVFISTYRERTNQESGLRLRYMAAQHGFAHF